MPDEPIKYEQIFSSFRGHVLFCAGTFPRTKCRRDVGLYHPSERPENGPLPSKDPTREIYNYLYPGVKINRSNYNRYWIGTREFEQKILVKESLFQGLDRTGQPKKHGLQREWYPNGNLKSEKPYTDGLMNGMFRQWSQDGKLISQYRMQNGKGVVQIFNEDGVLVSEKNLANNVNNGMSFEMSPSSKNRSFVWYKEGNLVDTGFEFLPDGSLKSIVFFREPASGFGSTLHGPSIEYGYGQFSGDKHWFVTGQEVSEEKYAKLARDDKSLPAYYADSNKYKEFITPEIKALFEKYRTMKRVKIPLQVMN